VRLFAVCTAVRVEAARVEGFGRGGAAAGEAGGAAAYSPATAHAKTPGKDRAARERELEESARFVDSVNFKHVLSLSDTRDILFRFEALRSKVLAIAAYRDMRSHPEIRRLLHDIRTKSDLLKEMAMRKESEGEVDDGGDVFPSQRDNICTTIELYDVKPEICEEVKLLCDSMDALRALILAGEREAVAVREVSGHLHRLKDLRAYDVGAVAWGIASLLGEESRWRKKVLARLPSSRLEDPESSASAEATEAAVQEAPVAEYSRRTKPSEQGKEVEAMPSISQALSDIGLYPHLDLDQREAGLREAQDYARKISIEDDTDPNVLRTHLLRLDLYTELVADYIKSSDAAFLEKIRGVLQLIKEKWIAIKAAIADKELEGKGGFLTDLRPSQRSSVCRNMDALGLAADLRAKVKNICESLDRVRDVVEDGDDGEAALMKVFRRVNSLVNTGRLDKELTIDLELVVAEEWRWVGMRTGENAKEAQGRTH